MSESTSSKTQVQGIESEAQKLKNDLESLMNQIKTTSQTKGEQISDTVVKEFSTQLEHLKKSLGSLSSQNSEMLDQIDKKVRANPYLYLMGAVVVGIFLGKTWRS
jgi:ElaB/YqjD/DUF883 family membrane-anchored ribosome-binding protein